MLTDKLHFDCSLIWIRLEVVIISRLGKERSMPSHQNKQKLNTKSSTEAELVGASDFLPQTVWTTNFIKAQGYKSEFHQDNMSSMKIEKNGRVSVHVVAKP